MSDQPTDFNPYQATSGPVSLSGDHTFLGRVALELARWQTFFAVLMSIGFLGMMGMVMLSMLGGSDDVAEMIGGMACAGVAAILIYGLPAFMLWKAAAGARRYAKSPGSTELAEFASSQLSFWRTVGIIAAIVVGLYAIVFVGMMLFGVGLFFST